MKIIKSKLPNGGELHKYTNGYTIYLLNNQFHREDGPAIQHDCGDKSWWLNGKLLPCRTQMQFERLMRLKAFW
jgi:hypothetical protein